MSTSLRDQLLKAGLISKKQVNDAERQQQRQERHPPGKRSQGAAAPAASTPRPVPSAKATRDQALNRQRDEKAAKKARLAQIKQLVEQNRVPTIDGGEPYNFLDGAKIRRIPVDSAIRERLGRGDIVIVRNDGGYDLVPAAIAARIRERDEHAVVISGVSKETPKVDDGYEKFAVPDDLIW